MKMCIKCHTDKCLDNFGKDKYRKDGLNPYCKECIKNRALHIKTNNPEKLKEWRKKYNSRHRMKIIDYRIKYYGENRDEILRKNRELYERKKIEISIKRALKRRTEESREKAREYGKKSRKKTGNAIKYVTKWRKENPHKSAVHTFVLWAVRVGVMKKPESCEKCGKIAKIQGHHIDYNKPMEVEWLCSVCHGEKHRKL